MHASLLLLLAAQADQRSGSPASLEFVQPTDSWHAKRLERLTAEDGWLSVVGLFWLEGEGATAGSDSKNDFVFPPSAPAKLGRFERRGNDGAFIPEPGAKVLRGTAPFPGGVLGVDPPGPADVLTAGTVSFHLIRRGDRLGVRVKDSQAPARKAFAGISRFPVREAFRVTARLEPSTSPRKLAVPTVLGTLEPMDCPGALVFTLEGQEHRLLPVLESDGSLFLIFADATNGTDTYGAGRFLFAPPPKNGEVVLDFNRAINPPCAFTAFATCPLPPKENRLLRRVEAGERRYEGPH